MCNELEGGLGTECNYMVGLGRTIPYDYCCVDGNPAKTSQACLQKYLPEEKYDEAAYCLQKQCFDSYTGQPNNAMRTMACEMSFYEDYKDGDSEARGKISSCKRMPSDEAQEYYDKEQQKRDGDKSREASVDESENGSPSKDSTGSMFSANLLALVVPIMLGFFVGHC